MKILMTLMGLEIGGAETHVVELCRELAARGYEITVASNGGVYVDELSKVGVKHVWAPLNTKSPASLLKSYHILYKLIRDGGFDLVHAHARIPAFVCGLVRKRLPFRFVTSTHGVFKVDPLLTRLTDWGEYAVAVSYDIRQYLIENYHMPTDSISVTINGIDTNRFSADTPCEDVKAEFGLADGKFRVIYVSRIDTEAALPGFLLCGAAEKLASQMPELEILIVGGGTAFEELKAKAGEVNAKVGRTILRLTGSRTDVPQLIASSDVFVGVSRAALEAMSEEKPVVLAGAQGYIGVFEEAVRQIAEDTNFCARGCALPDEEKIVSDLRRLYAMSEKERAEMGAYNRREILDGYSVSRMADDYEAAWAKLTPYEPYRRGDVIISGYYGFDNMGDDSLLAAMIDGIRKREPDAKITVLTNDPKRTAEVFRVRAVNRFSLPAVRSAMKHAKLLISGGGSLLQDGTSRKSLYYYYYIIALAKRMGLKVMLCANGLGPLRSAGSRKLAAKALNAADYISLREEEAFSLAGELLGELGVPEKPLRLSADPAFGVSPCDPKWAKYLAAREGLAERCFIVSVKEGSSFGTGGEKDLATEIASDVKTIAERYGLEPLFVPLHAEKDLAVTKELAGKVGCGKVLTGLAASEVCALMARCELVIGTRLHMLIFAAAMGLPMIGISYDPKIDAFMKYIGEEDKLFDIRTLQSGQLAACADRVMAEKDRIRSSLVPTAERLRALTEADMDEAVRLMRSETKA